MDDRGGVSCCNFGERPDAGRRGGRKQSLWTPHAIGIESVLGAKVALKSSGPMPGGKTELCTGQTPTGTVTLRLVTGLDPGRDRSGSKEMKGIEIIEKMGAQVDVTTFGPVTCSTIVPPESLAQQGFNTTCTVSDATAVAGIEVLAKTRKDMISIERLRPIEEKMARRF